MVFILALLKIMLVNIILSGDNAVVIALAGRNLEKRHQNLAIIWGSLGAIVLRVGLTVVAVILLQIPFLQIAGGLLLIWIAVKLLTEENNEENVKSQSTLMGAIRTIIIADVVMSLDNTLAIAAIAENNYLLLTLGLALSIPLIVFGSKIIMLLMDRFPIIVYVGAGLIAWTSGEMLIRDDTIQHFLKGLVGSHVLPGPIYDDLGLAIPIITTIAVILPCFLHNRKRSRKSGDVLTADEHAVERMEDKIE